MAPQKFRKSRSRKTVQAKRYKPSSSGKKTVRRHRTSTAGKILPPLDVRSNKHLKEFEKRIKKGDLTIILVWAPWCPHCHTMMPHFDAASKSPNRSIQSIKVQDTMLPAVNQILTSNINKQAKPINVEGYPSIIVVDKNGNKVTDIEPVRNTESMKQLMENAGPLAEAAGLNKSNINQNTNQNTNIANSLKNSLKSVKASPNSLNKNKNPLENLGIEDEGLVTGIKNSPRNINLGEEELKGSMVAKNTSNKNIKLNSIPNNKMGTTFKANTPKEKISESIAPSPINSFNTSNTSKNLSNTPPADLKKLSQEAEEVTSLVAPMMPPTGNDDMESESISNSLTPEEKVSGGGKNGGSMLTAMARTTYTLAPAAALLATAALVMRGKKNHSRKHSKNSRKTHKRR